MSTDIGPEINISNYNFKEIAEMRPAISKAASLLRSGIDSGTYDALISDETGARLPTLVLREVINLAKPDNAGLPVYFIQGGFALTKSINQEGINKIADFFRQKNNRISRALLVSEFMFTGNTVETFTKALESGGVNFDVLVLYSYLPSVLQRIKNELEVEGEHKLYAADDYVNAPGHEEGQINFSEKDPFKMTGVIKRPGDYSLHPGKISEVLKITGERLITVEENAEIFDIKPGDSQAEIIRKFKDPKKEIQYQEALHRPLTAEDEIKINHDVALARQDIKRLAREVYQEVWLNKK